MFSYRISTWVRESPCRTYIYIYIYYYISHPMIGLPPHLPLTAKIDPKLTPNQTLTIILNSTLNCPMIGGAVGGCHRGNSPFTLSFLFHSPKHLILKNYQLQSPLVQLLVLIWSVLIRIGPSVMMRGRWLPHI